MIYSADDIVISRACRSFKNFIKSEMMALLKDKVSISVSTTCSESSWLTSIQVVIVTGSSSGIGLATLQNALEEGAKVVGVDIAPPPQSFSAQVAENYHFLQADLTNPDAPSQVVAKALEAYGGRIDALFNIAGVMDDNSSVDNVTDEMWDRCIAINLTAPVMLMREVVKVMKEQKSGSIVNVASKAGMSGGAAGVAYTASMVKGSSR